VIARLTRLQPYIVAILFLAAGAAHFIWPEDYERVVPDYLPAHRALVAITGFFEILGGLGALHPATRRLAGWCFIALLLSVFPANIFMAANPTSFSDIAPAWLLYARLPLQFALMAWVYWVLVRR